MYVMDRDPGLAENEAASYRAAYEEAPWGEIMDSDEAQGYLASFHHEGHKFAYVFRDRQNPPYLFVHGTDYRNDIKRLFVDEFSEEENYYPHDDPSALTDILEDCGNVTFISNVHADRSVELDDSLKPRLQVLPELLDELFEANESDSIVLYTHRKTGLFRYLLRMDPDRFAVEASAYDFTSKPSNITEDSDIDQLELVVIRKAY